MSPHLASSLAITAVIGLGACVAASIYYQSVRKAARASFIAMAGSYVCFVAYFAFNNAPPAFKIGGVVLGAAGAVFNAYRARKS